MTTALQSAESHLADLAANGVPARDKPSAFHHGLITQLVAELRETKARAEAWAGHSGGACGERDALREIVRRLVEWETDPNRKPFGYGAYETLEPIIADARKVLR